MGQIASPYIYCGVLQCRRREESVSSQGSQWRGGQFSFTCLSSVFLNEWSRCDLPVDLTVKGGQAGERRRRGDDPLHYLAKELCEEPG
jgi:hypothetical protein